MFDKNQFSVFFQDPCTLPLVLITPSPFPSRTVVELNDPIISYDWTAD